MKWNDFQNLIEEKSDAELEEMAHLAHDLTRQRFGKTVQLYAPLYLSNECASTCTYCGFSQPNTIIRKTLNQDEVLKEASFLIQHNFCHLLLVSGDIPGKISVDYLIELSKILRPRLSSLSIEVAPFHRKDYEKLAQTGIDGICLYQETYNPIQYQKYHLAGPKKNFAKRLQHLEEAAQAGFRKIGLGILLGLADWRQDAIALVKHTQDLRKKYWKCDFSISLPRLRPSASAFTTEQPVSDRNFVQLICALRITFPELGITLSTRESPAMRDALLHIGVTQMSAGSRTEPGGYLQPEAAEKQFALNDERAPYEVAAAIQKAGLEPVWKDWEPSLH